MNIFFIAALLALPNFAHASWHLDTEKCRMSYKTQHITLSTDGRLSDHKIYLKLQNNTPLATMPEILFTENDRIVLTPSGTRQTHGVEFPYHPKNIANLLKPESAFVIRYTPIHPDKKGKNYTYKVVIPTHSLPVGIMTLSKICYK